MNSVRQIYSIKRISSLLIMLLLSLQTFAQQIKKTDIIGVWETVEAKSIHGNFFGKSFTIEPEYVEGEESLSFATYIDGSFFIWSNIGSSKAKGTFTFDGNKIYADTPIGSFNIYIKFLSPDRIIARFDLLIISIESEMVKTSGAYEGPDNCESFYNEGETEKDSFPWLPVIGGGALVAIGVGIAVGVGAAGGGAAGAGAAGATPTPPIAPAPQPVPPAPQHPMQFPPQPPTPIPTPPPAPQPTPPQPPTLMPNPAEEAAKKAAEEAARKAAEEAAAKKAAEEAARKAAEEAAAKKAAEEAARKAAEEAAKQEKYLDGLRNKYGLPKNATLEDIKNHVRGNIKEALKDLDAANAESFKMDILVKGATATQIAIDTTMDIAGKATGPAGRVLAGTYTTIKNFAGECTDASLNGKSLKDAMKKAGINSVVEITQSNMGSIGWKAAANVMGDAVKGGAGAYIDGKDGLDIVQETLKGASSGAVKTIIDAKISDSTKVATAIKDSKTKFEKGLDVADDLFNSGDISEKTRNALYDIALRNHETTKTAIGTATDATTGLLQGGVGTLY
ncbi:MAG: hypothetical protein MJZ41_08000 [Bacteroidaceae bacterium]|nr:hypothetical protein [Bacteroidaceae bacterium]